MMPLVTPPRLLPHQNRWRDSRGARSFLTHPLASRAALLLVATALAFASPVTLPAQTPPASDIGNPTGNAGQFNGNVTTGSSYDPLTGNATRTITDLVVPGSVGQYPLVFARTTNSRFMGVSTLFGDGGNWRHNFQYELRYQNNNAGSGTLVLHYPDGRRVFFTTLDPNGSRYAQAQVKPPASLLYGPPGIRDRLDAADAAHPRLLMNDGGQVLFEQYVDTAGVLRCRPTNIFDPSGKITGIDYWSGNSNNVHRVYEPGGRWIQLDYLPPYDNAPYITIRSVTAWNGQQVIYNYGAWASNPQTNVPYVVLSTVQYTSEPTNADPNAPVTASYSYSGDVTGGAPVLGNCSDPHYPGAMWAISYYFNNGVGPDNNSRWGQVRHELSPWTGEAVSTLNSETPNDEFGGRTRQETRGDSAEGTPLVRTFGYWPGSGLLHYSTDYKNGRKVFQYDQFGYLASINDWRNWQTVFTNEPHVGAVTQVTLPPDQRGVTHTQQLGYTDSLKPYYLASRTDANTQTTFYDRDGLNRVWRIRYPDGGFEQFGYDDSTNGCGQVYQHRLVSGGTITYHYGSRGLLLSMDAPNSDGGVSTTTYDYDTLDRLRIVTDARGFQTTYRYNGRHQITRVIHPQDPARQQHPGDSAPVTNYVAYAYDDLGNRTSVTDECSHSSNAYYDNYRRPTLVTDPLGHCNFYSYERRRPDGTVVANPYTHTRTAWTTLMRPSYAAGARYKHTFRAFDAFFRLKSLTTGLGGTDGNWPSVVNGGDAARTDYSYDADGNLTGATDPRGRVTSYGIDSRGRRVSMTLPADGQFDRTYAYDYDGVGNLTQETRPGGSRSLYGYDSMNRRFRSQDPLDRVTRNRIGYGPDGAPPMTLTVNDPNNNRYATTFDGLGRKAQMDYPGGGGSEFWHYDGAGNPDRFTNRAGQVKTLAYNNRNALETTAWNANGRSTWNAYYADGLPQWKTVNAGSYQTSLSYWFDAAGRPTYEHQSPDTNVNFINVSSAYDDDNTRVQAAFPGGDVQRYLYSDRLQLQNVAFNGPTVATFNYAADSTPLGRNLFNGTSTSYNFDGGGRLATLDHFRAGDPNNLVTCLDYGYDALTRRTYAKRREDGRGDRYSYQNDDQIGFVNQEAFNVDTASPSDDLRQSGFGYDAAGNRTVANAVGFNAAASVSAQPDALNRYVSLNGQGVGYDANGNLTFDPLTGSSYTYDADSQLTRAVNPQTGTVVNFGYDALGRCVWRQEGDGGPKTLRYYDAMNLVEERQNGNRLNRYVHGAGVDQPLLMVRADGSTFGYHQDANNNVVALTDAGGSTVERYRYDPFGRPYVLDGAGGYTRGDASAYGNRFLFTGREWQAALKLYDYRARIYSPALGRFLQSDPIGFGGGNHLYRYCGNETVNSVDPSGLILVSVQNNAIGAPAAPSRVEITGSSGPGFRGDNLGNPFGGIGVRPDHDFSGPADGGGGGGGTTADPTAPEGSPENPLKIVITADAPKDPPPPVPSATAGSFFSRLLNLIRAAFVAGAQYYGDEIGPERYPAPLPTPNPIVGRPVPGPTPPPPGPTPPPPGPPGPRLPGVPFIPRLPVLIMPQLELMFPGLIPYSPYDYDPYYNMA